MSGPITQGKDFNFFRRVAISSTVFANSADVEIAAKGHPSFYLVNEGNSTIEYSFNGTTLHGDMVPATPSTSLIFNNRGISKIWFRVPSGVASNVRVEATTEGTINSGSIASSGGGGGSSNVVITTPLGSKTKAESVAVTLSTNEPTLAVSGAVTISGTVTSNIGTTNGLALDATLTGGTATTITRGGAKGATTAATITSTANGADHQGLDVVEQFKPVYEDNSAGRALVEQRNSFTNITTATTTVVKSGAGFLHLIQVNKAASNGVITIYDNTAGSGTLIGTVTMPAALLASQVNLRYDVTFATGLTIVTSVSSQDLTCVYR